MRAIVASMLFIAATAFASVTVTETKGPTVLHAADGSTKTFTDKPDAPSHAACAKAVQDAFKGTTPSETATCWDGTTIVVKQMCDDAKAPTIPLVKNAQGDWDEPDAVAVAVPGSDSLWNTVQWLYVHNSAWPDGFPNCWVRGWAPPEEWRVNGSNSDAVFMERIEPGMADLEQPLIPEPFVWPGDQPPTPAPPPA